MKTLLSVILGVILLALFAAETSLADIASKEPNVVLIYIDDLGYGILGCYGCKDIPTPNIDRLAKEGVRCTASYIANPPCCPSRCSLMMGQYGQRFGKYGMSRGLPIPEDRPTLARFLRDHGYVTGQIGKWDIGTGQQGPLNVGFTEVRRKLAGAIVSVDDQVGKLLDMLNRHGLRENTLIIFSSDNGANGGEGGSSTPYTGGKGQGTQKEGWVRVPTIFSMPGLLPEGKQYDGLIANFDFYSTIAYLTTHTFPRHCDGVDLFPYLCGEQSGDAHEYLFWLNNQPNDAVRRHLIAVRWHDWRLYRKYEQDRWQLFDLKSDPREEHDIASKHPDVVKQMAAQHTAWKQTLAPLGEIPKIRAGEPIIPSGHGWAFASEKAKGDTE